MATKRRKGAPKELVERVREGVNVTISDLRKIAHYAERGDRKSQAALSFYNDDMASMLNELQEYKRRKKKDYGNSYGLIEHFTSTQYDDIKLKTSKQLKRDWDDILLQSTVMLRATEYKDFSIIAMEETEKKRIATMKNRGILPNDISTLRAKNFLRFLGREESVQIIGEYGKSDKIIDMIYQAYIKKGNTRDKISKAFTEYLGRRNTDNPLAFDTMMERLGIYL